MIIYRHKSKHRKARKARKARRHNPKRRHARRKHTHYNKVRSQKRRTNPKRRHSRRRNPGFAGIIPSKTFFLSAAGTVAGYVIGNKLIPLYAKIPGLAPAAGAQPSAIQQYAPGALNILAGSFAAMKLKGELARAAGIGVAASGLISILHNVMPSLLGTDGLPPSLGYRPMGADLGASDMVRIGDEVVRVGADLGESDAGDSIYERV